MWDERLASPRPGLPEGVRSEASRLASLAPQPSSGGGSRLGLGSWGSLFGLTPQPSLRLWFGLASRARASAVVAAGGGVAAAWDRGASWITRGFEARSARTTAVVARWLPCGLRGSLRGFEVRFAGVSAVVAASVPGWGRADAHQRWWPVEAWPSFVRTSADLGACFGSRR